MRRVRQKNTAPELHVRRALNRLGLRFRLENRDLPGSPDFANRKHRWAIFVHGCFWHRHEGCPRTTTPKRNRAFWKEKFAANQIRDRQAIVRLEQAGFQTLVIWECETDNPQTLDLKLRSALIRPLTHPKLEKHDQRYILHYTSQKPTQSKKETMKQRLKSPRLNKM